MSGRRCAAPGCTKTIRAKRSTRRTCSDACRQALKRSLERGPVVLITAKPGRCSNCGYRSELIEAGALCDACEEFAADRMKVRATGMDPFSPEFEAARSDAWVVAA